MQSTNSWSFMSEMLRDKPESAIKAVCLSAGRQLADDINNEMRSRRLSQQDLAEKMGRSPSSLSRFMRGLEEGRINIEDLARLSIIFQRHLDISIAGEEKNTVFEEGLKKIETLIRQNTNKLEEMCSSFAESWIMTIPRGHSQKANLLQRKDAGTGRHDDKIISIFASSKTALTNWHSTRSSEEAAVI